MDKVIINNIPSSNRKEFGYRSINSSSEHNINQNEMLDDILDLYNKANAIERVVNENIDFIKQENSYLQAINKSLLDKMEDLKIKYEGLLGEKEEKKILITPYDCITYDESFSATIDKITSDITVRPSKKISKVAIFDSITDSMFLPDTLTVDIRTKNKKGIISEIDNDIYAPFHKDNELYWTRKIVSDNTIDFIETEYIINLPEDIMTTPQMNEIYINPFLATVTSVQARYGDSSKWEDIDSTDLHPAMNPNDTIDAYINSTRPFRLNFRNKKANQVKITIKCNNFTEGETNLRAFTYGIKSIGIFINYYNNYEPSSFQFEVSIPEVDNYVITGVTPFFNNSNQGGAYSRDFVCDMYYKDSAGYFHKIVDVFPFTPKTNDIMVRCRFGEKYGEINIKKLELSYKKL